MLTVDELRRLYGDCEGRSDEEILKAYHAKFYSQTDYESFMRRQQAMAEARRGKSRGSGGGKRPDKTRQQMALHGLGLDEKTDIYFPYLKDENGNLALTDKGERILDYNAKGVVAEEYLAELERKAQGQGLNAQQANAQAEAQGQAASLNPQDAAVMRGMAEAEHYEGDYLNDAIQQSGPRVDELGWRREEQGSPLLAPMEWQDYAPEMNALAAGYWVETGNRGYQAPTQIADMKRAGLRGAMRLHELAVPIDAEYQPAVAEMENYDEQAVRRGIRGAIRNGVWGAPNEQESQIEAARNQREERQRAIDAYGQWRDAIEAKAQAEPMKKDYRDLQWWCNY